MSTGSFNPSPFRVGSAAASYYKGILESLLESYGTGLSNDQDSYVYAEAMADARTITELWLTNQRFANQWDPDRMTDFLGRWMSILGIASDPTDTPRQQRAKVKAKLQLIGKAATTSDFYDLCLELLGDILVSVDNQTADQATSAAPGGLTLPGGVTVPDGDWCSSVSYVAIHIEKPSTMTQQEFQITVDAIRPVIDGFLPAWADWGVFENSPSLGDVGFVLDENNLDTQGFAL